MNWKMVDFWAFDLDNTLYPASTRLFDQVDVRMKQYVAQYLKVDLDEAHTIQKKYFYEFGTTLRGLMTQHDMDPAAYLDYVHDIDVAPVMPSAELKEAIEALPGQKFIFTNASRGHAQRILERLDIAPSFDGIFDIVDADYRPKPEPTIYDDFIAQFQIDPTRCAMVEDMARNLEPAHERGMKCVWVETDADWARQGSEQEYVHARTNDLAAWLSEILK